MGLSIEQVRRALAVLEIPLNTTLSVTIERHEVTVEERPTRKDRGTWEQRTLRIPVTES